MDLLEFSVFSNSNRTKFHIVTSRAMKTTLVVKDFFIALDHQDPLIHICYQLGTELLLYWHVLFVRKTTLRAFDIHV